jgi:quercetin dioxygenase-like cupin family protein
MLVKITEPSIFQEDERGVTYDFIARPSSYFIVLNRKAGTVSGSHYHRGTIQSKSPETFYLMKGVFELFVRDTITGNEERYTLQEGTKLEIPPNTYHEVKAITDIILLELNVSKDDFRGYEDDIVR